MGCQAAAPSAAGSTSCFAARSALSCSVAASGSATAAADPWQDNSLLRCSTLARAQTRDCNIGTLANQQLSLLGRTCLTRPSQDSVAASLSLVWALICSSTRIYCRQAAYIPIVLVHQLQALEPPAKGADSQKTSDSLGKPKREFPTLTLNIAILMLHSCLTSLNLAILQKNLFNKFKACNITAEPVNPLVPGDFFFEFVYESSYRGALWK